MTTGKFNWIFNKDGSARYYFVENGVTHNLFINYTGDFECTYFDNNTGLTGIDFCGKASSFKDAISLVENNFMSKINVTPVVKEKEPEVAMAQTLSDIELSYSFKKFSVDPANPKIEVTFDFKTSGSETLKYTTNGKSVKSMSKIYREPFEVDPNTEVRYAVFIGKNIVREEQMFIAK